MKKLTLISFTIIALLICAQLLITNSLAIRGEHLAQLQRQASDLQKQNDQLRQQIATQTSIQKIASQAAELGFVTPQESVSITLPPPLAFNGQY